MVNDPNNKENIQSTPAANEAGARITPDAQPSAAAKPNAGARPTAGIKSTPGAQPSAAAKPNAGARPAAGIKSAPGAQPSAAAKPDAGARPAAGAKSAPGAQPSAAAKPDAGARPAAGARTTPDAQPSAATKPNAGARPAADAKPNSGARPNTGAKPARPKEPAAEPKLVRIGRTLKWGGKTTIDYSRRAMSSFERFVENDTVKSRPFRFLRNVHISFVNFIEIAIVCIMIAALVFANSNIQPDERMVTIAGINDDFEGFEILHLSDLHGRRYGEKQASLLRAIANLSYDIVCITGDMVGASGDPEPFYELLEGLGTSKPVYFIAGDSDPGPLLPEAREIEGTLNQMLLEDWVLGAMERGATYLNKPISVKVGASTMWISPAVMLNVNADDALEMAEYETELQRSGVLSGIDVDYGTLPYTNYTYREMKALKEAALYMEDTDLHISLSHYPPTENSLSSAMVNVTRTENAYLFAPDLALCGHYCGGIWRIPVIGAFYIPNTLYRNHGWGPDAQDVSGMHQIASTMVYTSAGLGVTDYGFFPDFRVFNSPQISVITLTTTLTEDLLGAS